MMSKRMKLISHVEYEKLVNASQSNLNHQKTLPVKSFNQKDSGLSSFLNLNSLPDDIKLALFNTAARGLHAQFENLSQSPQNVKIIEDEVPSRVRENESREIEQNAQAPVDNPPSLQDADIESESNQRLLEMVAPKFRPAAKFIMTALLKTDDVSWESGGEVSFSGEPRPGANILDLLSWILRPTFKLTLPVGGNTFLYVLKKLSIPSSIMGLKIRTLPRTSLGTLRTRRTAATPINFGSPNETFESPPSSTPPSGWASYIS